MPRLAPWHVNLAVMCLAIALAMIGLTFVLPFIPLFVQELGVTDATDAARWASVISAASAITMAFAQPWWGHLADRYGRKPMVVRAMFGAGLAICLMGIATAPEHLLVIRLFQGAVTGTVAASNALVSTTVPKERMGFAMGLMQLAMFLGLSAGPFFGGLAADLVGSRGAFYIAGAMSGAGGLLVLILAKERFVRPALSAAKAGVLRGSLELFKLPFFSQLTAMMFVLEFSGVIVVPVLTLFIAGMGGVESPASATGMVLGVASAASAVAAVASGRLGDKIGHSWIMLVSLLAVAATTLPQAYATEVWQLLTLRAVGGAFIGAMVPSINSLVVRVVPAARRGSAFGLQAMAGSIAAAAGPLAGAGILSVWPLGSIFIIIAAMFFASFIAAGWQIAKVGLPEELSTS